MQKGVQARLIICHIRARLSNQFRPTHSHLATSPPGLARSFQATSGRREPINGNFGRRAALSDGGWPLDLAIMKTYLHRTDRLILE